MQLQNRQQGAALVIGLVILMVMTLIGISSMSSTTTELKIANNLQTYNTSFQVAESAVQIVIDPANPVNIDWISGNPQTFNNVHSATLSNGSIVEADLQLDYADCATVIEGFSLTHESESGDSGGTPAVVQDALFTGRTLNSSGDEIATKTGLLVGKQTIAAGCPE